MYRDSSIGELHAYMVGLLMAFVSKLGGVYKAVGVCSCVQKSLKCTESNKDFG